MSKPSHDFRQWAARLNRLHEALRHLADDADRLGVPAPAGQEWYELLVHKLVPQTQVEPWLVVAVVGGTNIGKSLLFNHLAGQQASAVSPLAAGTKHPVCLTPPGFAARNELAALFEGFDLTPWRAADDPLSADEADRLYWRDGANVPPRLLLLDTPDIDSDRQVNWRRADAIRRASDVLIAVLTQQKYNDAAVKQFFRRAAEADKAVIVVFNQVDLAEDRAYWPLWLETFTGETGVAPVSVYVVPHDRAAAARLDLPFFDVGVDGHAAPRAQVSLRDDLAALRFDEIKLRTLRGALAEVTTGAPAYLAQLRSASGQFETGYRALASADMARVQWPTLPTSLLVDEIRTWWDAQRSDWSRRVHGAYRTAWRTATWPLRTGWRAMNPPPPDPLVAFRAAEREAIARAVEELLAQLTRLAEVGNDILRPRLQALLGGEARRDLLARIAAAHDRLPPVADDYRVYLQQALARWVEEHPGYTATFRSLDQVAAIARPALTVSLFFGGFFLVDGIAHQAAVQAAGQAATHLATEAAVAGGVTGGGEAVVAAAGHGLSHAVARLFADLQQHYAQSRVEWFYATLSGEFLGGLLDELQRGAELPRSPHFLAASEAAAAIQTLRA